MEIIKEQIDKLEENITRDHYSQKLKWVISRDRERLLELKAHLKFMRDTISSLRYLKEEVDSLKHTIKDRDRIIGRLVSQVAATNVPSQQAAPKKH